jgi:uncharacterized protein (DUF58 family)
MVSPHNGLILSLRKRIHDPRVRLQNRLVPLLVILLFGAQWLSPYDGWLILLTGLAGAWLVSYVWARWLANGLELQREVRYGWAQVGDQLEERFTLNNRSLLPALWVEIIDHTTMPDYQVSRATAVNGLSSNRWVTQGICTRRGLYRLGPTSLKCSDPLGIYAIQLDDPRSADLMVTPPIVPLPPIQVAPGGRSGEGQPRPNAPERTVSAAMVREFVPGDDLRWLHWRTTARREQPHVRLFDGTPAGDWWILLDMDAGVQLGQGQNSTEEHAVILAASLADRGLRQRRAVGLVANSRELVWLPPRSGDAHRWEILRSLALVSPSPNNLEELLTRIQPIFSKQASLILITANTQGDWLEALLPLIWKGAVPSILLLEPLSFGGQVDAAPLMGQLVKQGIAHTLIPRSLLDRPEARPGREGRWEWRVTSLGKAIPIQRPAEMEWRELRS